MMDKFRNQMRLEAQRANSHIAKVRVGIIDGYDPSHYAVKVRIQPENTLTGWMPLTSPWVGNQWGFYAPPSLGDIVDVHYQQGDANAGFVVQKFFSNTVQPLAVPSGELWVVHKTGTEFKMTNDGNVLVSAAKDLRLEGDNVKIHGRKTFAFDADGQGQKWDGEGVETWQDDDVTKPHHDHAPPETP